MCICCNWFRCVSVHNTIIFYAEYFFHVGKSHRKLCYSASFSQRTHTKLATWSHMSVARTTTERTRVENVNERCTNVERTLNERWNLRSFFRRRRVGGSSSIRKQINRWGHKTIQTLQRIDLRYAPIFTGGLNVYVFKQRSLRGAPVSSAL